MTVGTDVAADAIPEGARCTPGAWFATARYAKADNQAVDRGNTRPTHTSPRQGPQCQCVEEETM